MKQWFRAVWPRRWFILLVVGVVAVVGADRAAAQSGEAPPVEAPGGASAVPDVVVLVTPGPDAGSHLASVRDALVARSGIAWVAVDPSVTPPQIVVAFDPGAETVGLRSVEGVVADHPAAAELTVAGQAVADHEVLQRITRGLVLVVVLASLVLAGLVAFRLRPAEGALAGGVVGLSAMMAAGFTNDATGPFDGSIVTTPVPVVLAALLVATYLVFRLLSWFAEPVGADQAEMIRRSVLSVAVELALFLAGLLVVSFFTGVLGPGRAAAVGILFGAVVAAVVTLAVAPPVLAVMAGTGQYRQRPRFVPFTSVFPGPDGRQCPTALLIGIGAVLGLLALLSFQGTSSQLFDQQTIPEAVPAVPAGDPTAAVVAQFGAGADQQAKAAWLARVSQLPSVARVDTSTGRYVAGSQVALDPVPLAGAGIDAGDDAPSVALIIPDVASRSLAAQELVAAIESSGAPLQPVLAGPGVDAAAAAARDGGAVWLLMIALAVIAGATTFGLFGDPVLGAIAAGLRLLGSAALVGLYHLLTGQPTGSELQVMVLLTAAGCSLFELGFLRRLIQGYRTTDHNTLIDQALHREGWAAAMGLLVAAVAALGLLVVDLAVVRRFGLLLVVAAMIEIMVGMWLLRAPILGLRGVHHLASEPVRVALAALTGGGTDAAAQSRWNDIVLGLLRREFSIQSQPTVDTLDDVFVPGTALYRKALDHHQSLADAGLRIVGREPRLRTVRVVGTGEPAAVAVTVDHPPRQLVNAAGEVLGVRRSERRSLMLWLEGGSDGLHRIADTVELGVEPLGEESAPAVAAGLAFGAAVDPAGS